MSTSIFLSSKDLNALFDEDQKILQQQRSSNAINTIHHRAKTNEETILVPMKEYINLKEAKLKNGQLQHEIFKLEDLLQQKDEETKMLHNQLKVQLDTAKIDQNLQLQQQNSRLTNQLKELLKKNRSLAEESQCSQSTLMRLKIELQTTETRLQKEMRKSQLKIQRLEREIIRLGGNITVG